MNIGDLVQLSAYGLRRGYNTHIWTQNPKAFGIIVKIDNGSYPYRFRWSGIKLSTQYKNFTRHTRREIKFAYR